MEYSNDMNDVLENINNYNKNRDKKVLIIFDNMIADIMRSEKFKAIVKELFIRCRKLHISIVFITQSGHLDFKDFLKIYNYCTNEPYSFMMVDTRPTAGATFKKNFNEPIKNL